MTTANNTTTQGNVTNVRLFVLFVLLMLSTGAVAQTNTTSVVATTSTEVSKEVKMVIATDNAVASTTMDFAVWFTGSKKTNDTSSNGTFSKKQLINSGVNTNSVLIRSFLKKVSTQENGVA